MSTPVHLEWRRGAARHPARGERSSSGQITAVCPTQRLDTGAFSVSSSMGFPARFSPLFRFPVNSESEVLLEVEAGSERQRTEPPRPAQLQHNVTRHGVDTQTGRSRGGGRGEPGGGGGASRCHSKLYRAHCGRPGGRGGQGPPGAQMRGGGKKRNHIYTNK